MNIYKIRDLYESLGPQGFLDQILPLMKSGEILEDATDRDWRNLWEAVDSATFITLIGSRIEVKVRAFYELAENPLEPIFRMEPSSRRKETIVGLTGPRGLEPVAEGMPYPARGIGEIALEYENEKFGERVLLTEEVIRFDRTNSVIKAAEEVGKNAKLMEAELAATALLDASDNLYGDGSGIYTSTHGNVATSALSVDSLEAGVAAMRGFEDDSGRKLVITPKYLCVSEELRITGLKLLKSIYEPFVAEHQINILKEEGLTLISVPFWTSASAWVLVGYQPAAQGGYVKYSVIPLEVYTRRGQDSTLGFERDIVAQFKARLMCVFACNNWRFGYRGNS